MSATHRMNTERQRIEELKSQGFTADYDIRDGALVNLKTRASYPKDKVLLREAYRFEGMSNPADMSILYALETAGGEKGTMLVNYGPNTPQKIVQFFRDLEREKEESES